MKDDSLGDLIAETAGFAEKFAALTRVSDDRTNALVASFKPATIVPDPHAFDLPRLPRNENQASDFTTRLVKWIEAFELTLDPQHEVGARLVNFGQAVTIHLQAVGHWDPSLIKFRGVTETGEPVELIQHVSQINVLLVKLPRLDPTKNKRPIGFTWDDTQQGCDTP